MSEEHYPARSAGNTDIIKVNIIDLLDSLQSETVRAKFLNEIEQGKSLEEVAGAFFDKELAVPAYPKGRTARTLCRECNTFLGKYDEAYLKFYKAYGEPKIVKGFQASTKLYIIKSIYGKFLSLPEARNEEFDFVPFVKEKDIAEYSGDWRLYFVRRNATSDLLGLADMETGTAHFEQGIVYELTDDRFIFDLLNFEKHDPELFTII